jgi:hypothetical protein
MRNNRIAMQRQLKAGLTRKAARVWEVDANSFVKNTAIINDVAERGNKRLLIRSPRIENSFFNRERVRATDADDSQGASSLRCGRSADRVTTIEIKI